MKFAELKTGFLLLSLFGGGVASAQISITGDPWGPSSVASTTHNMVGSAYDSATHTYTKTYVFTPTASLDPFLKGFTLRADLLNGIESSGNLKLTLHKDSPDNPAIVTEDSGTVFERLIYVPDVTGGTASGPSGSLSLGSSYYLKVSFTIPPNYLYQCNPVLENVQYKLTFNKIVPSNCSLTAGPGSTNVRTLGAYYKSTFTGGTGSNTVSTVCVDQCATRFKFRYTPISSTLTEASSGGQEEIWRLTSLDYRASSTYQNLGTPFLQLISGNDYKVKITTQFSMVQGNGNSFLFELQSPDTRMMSGEGGVSMDACTVKIRDQSLVYAHVHGYPVSTVTNSSASAPVAVTWQSMLKLLSANAQSSTMGIDSSDWEVTPVNADGTLGASTVTTLPNTNLSGQNAPTTNPPAIGISSVSPQVYRIRVRPKFNDLNGVLVQTGEYGPAIFVIRPQF